MSDKVRRLEQLEAIDRLNELERVVPILRAALEHIATTDDHGAHAIARAALRDAGTPPTRRRVRGELPLDERGQIPGQLDAFALEDDCDADD